ncbi:hypothetical protein GW756_00090 [bacterium]|nr:hypothetical protein [bacterium]NCQ54757.1 hypothetical protein [Candidatus Parcubacteria bacterium]NCS68010.1 hypothetical protein [Candidatus Peregrinibacteria bacterium]NCS95747.1 hypothetical protein [bacterium]
MKKQALALMSVLLIVGCSNSVSTRPTTISPSGDACTKEAKICPDGSTVSRTQANCEFAACPTSETSAENTQSFIDEAQNVEFMYSDSFQTNYVEAQDWPPLIIVSNADFSCESGGNEIKPEGETVQRNLNGSPFCITTQSEGAAGSTYSNYTYKTEKEDKLVIFEFTLRFAQCMNYDEPEQMDCLNEQKRIKPDNIIMDITDSVQFSSHPFPTDQDLN